MEERKTAAIVLSILVLITVFFSIVLPYINLKKTHTISLKTCTVHFKYRYNVDTVDDGYIMAQRELGLCLCSVYDKKQVTDISRQIMKLYEKYGTSVCPDTVSYATYNNLDSVLKYRNKAFNPVIADD